MKGLSQRKPFDPYRVVPASTMSHQAGITVEGEGGETWITGEQGSWIRISGADFAGGSQTLTVTALAPSACTLYAVPDSPDAPAAAEIRLDLTGSAEPVSFSAPLSLEGIHDLYLVFDGTVALRSWQAE